MKILTKHLRCLSLATVMLALTATTRGAVIDDFIAADSNGGKLIEVLKQEKMDGVRVNQFVYQGTGSSSAGPGLQQALKHHLVQNGLMVIDSSSPPKDPLPQRIGAVGGFFSVSAEPPVVSLFMNVVDSNGRIVRSLTPQSTDPDLISVLLGLNANLAIDDAKTEDDPPAQKEQDQQLQVSLQEAVKTASAPELPPSVQIERSSEDADVAGQVLVETIENGVPVEVSPYRVEILSKPAGSPDSAYVPRPITRNGHGEPFVDLKVGEVYAVKLINNARDYDAGVSLHIDGLSSFYFSDNPTYQQTDKWLIPKSSSGTVRGWHRSNRNGTMRMNEFEVVRLAELDPKEPRSDVGAITAIFHAAWQPGEQAPGRRLNGLLQGAKATKLGQERFETLQEGSRKFGAARTIITIRYDIPNPGPSSK